MAFSLFLTINYFVVFSNIEKTVLFSVVKPEHPPPPSFLRTMDVAWQVTLGFLWIVEAESQGEAASMRLLFML